MIFSAPRFVVVDDKAEHLDAIIQTFQQLGSPCIGVRYDPAQDLDKGHFRGVRCLFLDLHLVDGQAGTDQRRHYALIASILEDNISQTGGPFILVIWTEHAHLRDGLREYLDATLDPAKPHSRPLAVIGLPKEIFINTGDGTVKAAEELRNAVREAILSNSQLAALLTWEADVLAAAGDTLASLLSLVPHEQKRSATFALALDVILSRLAREAVGPSNVDASPRSAIMKVLAPILADRITNQEVTLAAQQVWAKAVTQHKAKIVNASLSEAGYVNRMLHFAAPPGETIRPTDWGAVVEWPFTWSDFEAVSRFGLNVKQILGGEFRIERDDRQRCTPVLIRVGAVCDYAQNRTGPITFLFGAEIPEAAKRTADSEGQPPRLTEAIWRSPVFASPGTTEPVRLHVHIRLPLTVLRAECSSWTPRYRVREQLLMHLIATTSTYLARPGIVQLPSVE